MKDEARSKEFRKVEEYEQLLEELNRSLASAQRPSLSDSTSPILFVIASPRSGTTLLYELLAATGAFGYPSNLVARFPKVPWLGAQIERVLEPVLPAREWTFSSNVGRTSRWNGPHEFGYFWNRHFPFAEHHEVASDWRPLASFVRELAWMAGAFEKPLLFKSVLLPFSIAQIAESVEAARFLTITRNPFDTAESLLRTRERFYGDRERWYSVRPAGWDQPRTVEQQIAYQLARVKFALERSADDLGNARFFSVSYDALCADPREQLAEVFSWLDIESSFASVPRSFEAVSGGEGSRRAWSESFRIEGLI